MTTPPKDTKKRAAVSTVGDPTRQRPIRPALSKTSIAKLTGVDLVYDRPHRQGKGAMNTAKEAYDKIDSEAENGIVRGALQANLLSVASTYFADHPIASSALTKAARRLDIYESAALDA